MKTKTSILVFIICFWILSACQSGSTPPTDIATSIPATETLIPTSTPEPTATLEPSPTPITHSEVLDQTFSNVQIVYKDDFEYRLQGEAPAGWVSTDDNAVMRIAKDSNVKIAPRPGRFGGVFYYKAKAITPGEGVFLTFQYTGITNTFTWGIDNVNAQGEFFSSRTDGYYSFAMQMIDRSSLSAHVIEGPYLRDDNFKGDLKLLEGTWYNYILALDKDGNYIIKIWEPNSPEKQLVHTRNWPNAPTSYYFISWIGAERALWMDDFTIFSFDSLKQ